MTPEDRALLRARYEPGKPGAFYAFVTEVLDYVLLREEPHREVCDFISDSPGNGTVRTSNLTTMPLKARMAGKPDRKRKGLFMPRDSFKTTIAVVAYPIWRLVYDPTLRINISGYNVPRVRSNLTEIKSHFEDNPKIKAIFGDFCSKKKNGKWSAEEIQLFNPETKRLVPYRNIGQISISGLQSGYTGAHFDMAIVDDAVSERNVDTLAQLEKPTTHIRFLEPKVAPGGEILVVGTRYDYKDAYARVIKDELFDIYLRSAINPDNSLWFEQRLDRQYLKAVEMRLDTYIFSCQYLMEPVSAKEQIFQEEWIKACIVPSGVSPEGELDTREYVDPAATDNKRSDKAAILVASKDSNGDLWVRQATSQKMKDEVMINSMLSHYEVYKANVLKCESVVAFGLIEPLLLRIANDRAMRVNYVAWHPGTKKSKGMRIRSLFILFQTGRIKIPEDHYDLISQVRRYCGKDTDEDDLLDTLSMAAEDLVPRDVEHVLTEADVERTIAEWRRMGDLLPPEPFENDEEEEVFQSAFM